MIPGPFLANIMLKPGSNIDSGFWKGLKPGSNIDSASCPPPKTVALGFNIDSSPRFWPLQVQTIFQQRPRAFEASRDFGQIRASDDADAP